MNFPFLKLRVGCLVLVILTTPLLAETIIMKNGQVLNVQILNQTRKSITFRTTAGVRTVLKAQIHRIAYKNSKSKLEEAKKLKKEAQRKAKEEARRKAEEDAQHKAEEARQQAEEDAQQKVEEARRKAEEKEKLITAATLAKKKYQDNLAAYNRLRKANHNSNKTETKKQTSSDSVWSAVWRSAVLPGSGQLYNDQEWTGWGIMGAFAAATAYAGSSINSTNAAKATYDSTASTYFILPFTTSIASEADILASIGFMQTSTASRIYSTKLKQSNQALGMMGIIYLGQLLHAYFFYSPGSVTVQNTQRHSYRWKLGPGQQPGRTIANHFNTSASSFSYPDAAQYKQTPISNSVELEFELRF